MYITYAMFLKAAPHHEMLNYFSRLSWSNSDTW